MRERPYEFYDSAVSLCTVCLRRVDAKIVFAKGGVWMLKRCAEHGAQRVLLADDIEYYKRAREVFVKTPQQVEHYNTPTRYGCPYDCGICPDHEQHGCNILVEVTDACNLSCPTCYASSGPHRTTHRSLEHIERMLDRAVANEVEPDIVQISGGEPTLHPQFFEILDAAKRRPIRHLMVNTNGVRIARDRRFVERLKSYEPDFEIYLQYDSNKASALKSLRGLDLRDVHAQALRHLNEFDVATSLVSTVRRGVNDDELGELVEFAAAQRCVRGISFQPVQVTGRLEQYEGGYDSARDRLTLTEVRRKLLEQSTMFSPDDIIPVPCHADSLAMGYALKLDGKVIPLTGLVDPELLISAGRNTINYESEGAIHEALFDLFSTHHSPQSQTSSLTEFVGAVSERLDAHTLDRHNVFRVLIIEFLDAYSFDLRSVRKTCVHIVHPDAKRVIPFDTYNLLYRDELESTVLARHRANAEQLNGPISIRVP